MSTSGVWTVLLESLPQLDIGGAGALVLLEVSLKASSKLLSSEPVIEHVDDGGSLGVGNLIEDLINLGRAVDTVWDLNWVTAEFTVKIESHQLFGGEEL